MNVTLLSRKISKSIKKLFGIKNLTLSIRRKKQSFEKIIYRKKYTADDIIEILRKQGVKPGHPLVIHSAFGNLYNYQGTADELLDKLIEFLGPDGTLCLPAFPKDKYNPINIFDVRNTPSAAGYLTELFRKRPGVKRSLNQLHSVCALGKDADKIVGEHHLSRICFDEHSPYYIIGQLGGYSVNLGLPDWFIGTGGHVCEALVFDKINYFKNKFSEPETYTYINENGEIVKHTMLAKSKQKYIRFRSTRIIDTYFEKSKYGRTKLSNIWIASFDMRYLYERLSELAEQGVFIYAYPEP